MGERWPICEEARLTLGVNEDVQPLEFGDLTQGTSRGVGLTATRESNTRAP